jgi:hypothetical protein
MQAQAHYPDPAPTYREALPPNCPPREAVPLSARRVLRLISENPAGAGDFDSHATLGENCPSWCTPCEWASCSMFLVETRRENIYGLRRFPKLRNMKLIAHVCVDETSGKAGTVFSEIDQIIDVFDNSYGELRDSYGTLHGVLSRERLLRPRPESRFSTDEVANYETRSLAEAMKIEKIDELYEACDRNIQVFCKVILSVYRRAHELYTFHAEGRVQIEE